MNVNRVLFFKSNDSQKFYSSNKPGDFTTKIIPALDLEENDKYFVALDHISMAASWYNMRPEYENTKLRISKDQRSQLFWKSFFQPVFMTMKISTNLSTKKLENWETVMIMA